MEPDRAAAAPETPARRSGGGGYGGECSPGRRLTLARRGWHWKPTVCKRRPEQGAYGPRPPAPAPAQLRPAVLARGSAGASGSSGSGLASPPPSRWRLLQPLSGCGGLRDSPRHSNCLSLSRRYRLLLKNRLPVMSLSPHPHDPAVPLPPLHPALPVTPPTSSSSFSSEQDGCYLGRWPAPPPQWAEPPFVPGSPGPGGAKVPSGFSEPPGKRSPWLTSRHPKSFSFPLLFLAWSLPSWWTVLHQGSSNLPHVSQLGPRESWYPGAKFLGSCTKVGALVGCLLKDYLCVGLEREICLQGFCGTLPEALSCLLKTFRPPQR